jgi:hypothetical protein
VVCSEGPTAILAKLVLDHADGRRIRKVGP